MLARSGKLAGKFLSARSSAECLAGFRPLALFLSGMSLSFSVVHSNPRFYPAISIAPPGIIGRVQSFCFVSTLETNSSNVQKSVENNDHRNRKSKPKWRS